MRAGTIALRGSLNEKDALVPAALQVYVPQMPMSNEHTFGVVADALRLRHAGGQTFACSLLRYTVRCVPIRPRASGW